MDPSITSLGAPDCPVLPLERLRIPDNLSGRTGANRASRQERQIDANDDLHAIEAWLARYAASTVTLAAYRKEAERLLLWAISQRGKPVSSLTPEDLVVYQQFLTAPEPAVRWVIACRKKPGRSSPEWRPFAGPLAASSVRHAMTILGVMLSWMVDAGYLKRNPLSLALRSRPKSAHASTRYLTHELWEAVKATIESMPTATSRDRLRAARCRWLFTVLYLGGLRASEIANTPMGAIFPRQDAGGIQRWWIEIRGKGNKTRLVPASDELMAELASYRRAHRLTPEPDRGENRPLLLPLTGSERALTRGAIHVIVKDVFAMAATNVRARGPRWSSKADELASASAHWIRHTAGSHMTDQRVDLRFVRDNLGHASIATTNIYLHAEDDARHQATRTNHRIGWSSDAPRSGD